MTIRLLEHLPIDPEHSLDQLLGRFQSVDDGLPELIKNSKDQYARLGVTEKADRQIVVIATPQTKTVAVLDFAGATPENFEGWMTWSSRTASQVDQAIDIEGGHGNGGKAFMVRGSTTESFMESSYNGYRTKMGFKNDDRAVRYRPGYYQDGGRDVKNMQEPNPREQLTAVLADLGLTFANLPGPARICFERRQAYTLVQVGGVRDWERSRPSTVRNLIEQLPDRLRNHAQMALTLETSCVWVMCGRQLITSEPLSHQPPAPIPEFADLPPIPVPDTLSDPQTGDLVNTGSADGLGKYLRLSTSTEQLRISDRRKALNVIRVRNSRNIVAIWSVADLAPFASSAFIYGEVRLPALHGEHLAGADRQSVADTSLVRALHKWIEEQVQDLARRIQLAKGGREAEQERETVNNTLGKIRELMRRYLRPDYQLYDPDGPDNETGTETGEVGNDGTPPPGGSTTPRGSVVHGIEIENGRPRIALASGTSVPLKVLCYEVSPNGEKLRVPNVKVKLIADAGIVKLEEGNLLRGLEAGTATILVTDGTTESNPLTVEVVDCAAATIRVPPIPVKSGQSIHLQVSYHTQAGASREDLLIAGSVDEIEMGRLSRTGRFTAGRHGGMATVRVQYGPSSSHSATAQITITTDPGKAARNGSSGGLQPSIPLILLCGEPCPGMEDYPPEQRTQPADEGMPTIIDFDPRWENVIWINTRSKESLRIRSSRGGSSGMGSIATKTYQQFLTLKCFDILKRLKVRQEFHEGVATPLEFFNSLATAEIECADFLDASYQLVEEIVNRSSGIGVAV